ncbi:ejaculatory bulb-specific protein 3 [Lasius niger]|uniref:Ejaculatory bulb-specific protein 3 n=1 Tax=Lasius niger TaxID=67767 RepID=A0A0J7KDU9_LASNI|nr:ejaculatory bulb-specific protein 3 [Lasius niger]
MKLALVCLFAVSAIVHVYGRPQQYTDKFDNIDIDAILQNDRLLKRYVDCVLDKPNVRCPSEAIELKKVLSEALETDCAKCSNRQKELAEKTINYLVINKKNMWDEVMAKYDPEKKYAQKYEDRALKKQS